MKKIVSIIIMMFMIPCVVLADMGSPIIKSYKASVINPNGAVIYHYDSGKYTDSGKGLKYGTVITITDEDGEYCQAEEYDYDDYILIADIKAVEKSFTPEKLGDTTKYLTTKEVVIRKGPATGYEETGTTIPEGTTIEGREMLEKNEDGQYVVSDAGAHWTYVEYNGTKGFVDSMGAALAWKNEDMHDMVTFKTTEVYNTATNKVIATIPPKTTLKKANLYDLDQWSRGYYLVYDNIKGYVSYYDIATLRDKDVTVKTTKVLNLYEEGFGYDDEKTAVIGTVPEGTTFTTRIIDEDYTVCNLYYENGDTTGWLVAEVDENDAHCIGLKIDYPEDVSFAGDSTEDADDTLEVTVVEPATGDAIAPETIKKDNTSTVQLYMLLAVMICLTAVVIVLLINKGKNKKIETTEVKEEVKPEETVEEKKEE